MDTKKMNTTVKRIYVGNLPYKTTNEDLFALFSGFGEVASANVMMEKRSGKSKGFGFVQMSSDVEADAAIENLNGSEYEGRTLSVAEAKPMESRDDGGRRSFGGGNRDRDRDRGDRGGFHGRRRDGDRRGSSNGY
jgi:cold-inducible RNA-binding protein